MSWTSVSPSTATFTAVNAIAKTWSGVSVDRTPPPWGILSSVETTVDQGVDFDLRARNESPIYVSDDRPIITMEVQPEASP